MNEFGPKTTLEELECFAKNRGVSFFVRPPKGNSPMWTVGLKQTRAHEVVEWFGQGDKLWIAIDAASRKFDEENS